MKEEENQHLTRRSCRAALKTLTHLIRNVVAKAVERKHIQQLRSEVFDPDAMKFGVLGVRNAFEFASAARLQPEDLAQAETCSMPRLPSRREQPDRQTLDDGAPRPLASLDFGLRLLGLRLGLDFAAQAFSFLCLCGRIDDDLGLLFDALLLDAVCARRSRDERLLWRFGNGSCCHLCLLRRRLRDRTRRNSRFAFGLALPLELVSLAGRQSCVRVRVCRRR